MKILLAEDNAIVRKAVAAGLVADGYEVEQAEDGEKAFYLAHNVQPDLIISDVLMPNMDGFSLCQAVRDDMVLHDIPVVFYSATFLEPEDEALARHVGATGFVIKDENPKVFHKKLHQIVERGKHNKPPPFDSDPERRGEASRLYRTALVSKLQKKVNELEAEKRAARDNRQFLDHIVTTIPDVVFVLRLPELELSYIAPQASRLLGIPGEELIKDGGSWRGLVAKEDLPRVEQEIQAAITNPESTIVICSMQHAQGGFRRIEARISPRLNDEGEAIELVGSLHDVTKRVEAEEKLLRSEEQYHSLFEMMTSGMSVHELVYDDTGKAVDYRFLDVNPAFEKLTGLEADMVVGRTVREVLPGIDDEWLDDYIRVAQTGEPASFVRYAAPLGRYFQVVAYQTQQDHFATVFTDITEQRRAEEEIRNLARFPEENPNPVMRVNASGQIVYENPAGRNLMELCREGTEELRKTLISDALQALANDAPERKEYPVCDRYYSFAITPIKEAEYTNIYGRDITRRVVAAQQLERTNRVLRTLSQGNRTMIHAGSEDELLQSVCDVLAQEGNYQFVWAAYYHMDEPLFPQAQSGDSAERMQPWLDELKYVDLNDKLFAGLFDDSTPLLITDMKQDSWTKRQVAVVQDEDVSALLLLPLLHRHKMFGVIGIFSTNQDIFDESELSLLQEMAGDVSYGIESQRTHIAHEEGMERIQKTMLHTIEAVSLTLEKRDPYTAGHQQRVVQLAVAIAQEMGLDARRVEGLRLAALVHDIGKIHVPAEILNRPGRLSESEFGIIKSHPEVGYDILKNVEFDWPIADIVLQHHERCDGSGYPHGLKCEQIVPEARILAVADVVEAITSHRPYRPGLGLDVALHELEKGRGVLYAEDVVDTCLNLFRVNNFTWEGELSKLSA